MKHFFGTLLMVVLAGVYSSVVFAEDTGNFVLPVTEVEVHDILPPPGLGTFGAQTMPSAVSIPTGYSSKGIIVLYNELGFKNSGYRLTNTITRDRILGVDEKKVRTGQTVYFFNVKYERRQPGLLQIEADPSSPDTLPADFGQQAPVSATNKQPTYQYRFLKPGTYVYRNALIPYQRGRLVVEGSNITAKKTVSQPALAKKNIAPSISSKNAKSRVKVVSPGIQPAKKAPTKKETQKFLKKKTKAPLKKTKSKNNT